MHFTLLVAAPRLIWPVAASSSSAASRSVRLPHSPPLPTSYADAVSNAPAGARAVFAEVSVTGQALSAEGEGRRAPLSANMYPSSARTVSALNASAETKEVTNNKGGKRGLSRPPLRAAFSSSVPPLKTVSTAEERTAAAYERLMAACEADWDRRIAAAEAEWGAALRRLRRFTCADEGNGAMEGGGGGANNTNDGDTDGAGGARTDSNGRRPLISLGEARAIAARLEAREEARRRIDARRAALLESLRRDRLGLTQNTKPLFTARGRSMGLDVGGSPEELAPSGEGHTSGEAISVGAASPPPLPIDALVADAEALASETVDRMRLLGAHTAAVCDGSGLSSPMAASASHRPPSTPMSEAEELLDPIGFALSAVLIEGPPSIMPITMEKKARPKRSQQQPPAVNNNKGEEEEGVDTPPLLNVKSPLPSLQHRLYSSAFAAFAVERLRVLQYEPPFSSNAATNGIATGHASPSRPPSRRHHRKGGGRGSGVNRGESADSYSIGGFHDAVPLNGSDDAAAKSALTDRIAQLSSEFSLLPRHLRAVFEAMCGGEEEEEAAATVGGVDRANVDGSVVGGGRGQGKGLASSSSPSPSPPPSIDMLFFRELEAFVSYTVFTVQSLVLSGVLPRPSSASSSSASAYGVNSVVSSASSSSSSSSDVLLEAALRTVLHMWAQMGTAEKLLWCPAAPAAGAGGKSARLGALNAPPPVRGKTSPPTRSPRRTTRNKNMCSEEAVPADVRHSTAVPSAGSSASDGGCSGGVSSSAEISGRRVKVSRRATAVGCGPRTSDEAPSAAETTPAPAPVPVGAGAPAATSDDADDPMKWLSQHLSLF